MNQSPTLVQALVRDRVAELGQVAAASGPRRRGQARHGVIETARNGTGWMLVDLGLRLAVPRRAIDHPSA